MGSCLIVSEGNSRAKPTTLDRRPKYPSSEEESPSTYTPDGAEPAKHNPKLSPSEDNRYKEGVPENWNYKNRGKDLQRSKQRKFGKLDVESTEGKESRKRQQKLNSRNKCPANLQSLGRDPTFDFVDEDHHLHPNVMWLFKKKRVLGQGASCEVAHVVRKEDGREFAMKIMKRDDKWNPMLFRQEYELLTQLEHPNILKYKDCYMDQKNFYICTELCKGGELFDKIKEMKKFTEVEAADVVRIIVSAIAHCHQKDIVHRDLKPENIVFRTQAQKDLVIIDFGDAKVIEDDQDYEDFVGTAFYLSPECIRKRKGWELKKSDMWTIGVITYVLLTGRPPFHGRNNKEILKKILRAKLMWPKNCKISRNAKEFILGLINRQPSNRFSAQQALQHKWLRGEASTVILGSELQQSISNYSKASKLKKVLVRMLGNEMTRDDKTLIRYQFDQIDVDGKGVININDLTNFLLKQGGSRDEANAKASHIMSQIDGNNDGLVSIEEFKNAKLSRKIGNDENLLRKQFRRIDEDNDGFITYYELSKLFNGTLERAFIESMIKEIDENNDGKISYDEFVKAMKHGALENAFTSRPHIVKEMTAKMRQELMEEVDI